MRVLLVCATVLITLAVVSEARPKAASKEKCKAGPVDLVFIIDGSRSVRPHEFESMRKFMIDIIHEMDIGATATRVGVVQYSSQVQNVFSLKTHTRLKDMVRGINEIIPLAQGTMTGLGIRYAMNVAFSTEEGARANVPHVAVIVTDGRPQDRVAEVAAAARESGIEIFTVGVGRADMTSLRAMASPPFEDHVFLVESFDLIHQFGLQFQDKLCGIDLCVDSDHGCEHICESSPGSYQCLCMPGYTLNEDGKTCAPIDLCAEGKHNCEQICNPTPGEFTCACNPGYTLNKDKKTCTMIDLCAEGKHDCEQICNPTPGEFTCSCNSGYTLNEDEKTCTMIDLCAEGKHDCEQICNPTPGEFTCACNSGYTLNEDEKTCTMINYCSFGNHSCQHECLSVLNGYFCRCNEGYTLQEDGKTCLPDNLCNSVEHGCEHQCVSTPGSYHCVCPEGQLLQEDGKTCGTCRSANIDLVLLIDGSKSVRPQNFELVKKFVNQVVDSLDVSVHGTRIGLVQYSSRVRTEFPLNMYQTADEIKSAVMNVQYMEKGTMTGLALKHMVENSFSEAEGARDLKRNVPRIGLVFTDGRSQDDITEWAKKAQEAGITMYAVGVGKAVEDELREIASDPVEKHFFYSSDFTAINQIAENLKLNVCAEESQGEIEVKDPCACESLVEFQQATMAALDQLNQKLSTMNARLEDLENQLLTKK